MTSPPDNSATPPTEPAPDLAGRSADLTSRAAARIVDLLAVAVVGSMIWFVVALALGFGGFGPRALGFVGIGAQSVVTGLLGTAYFTFMEHTTGRTLGKMIVAIRVVGPDGNAPTLSAAFRRNAWLLIGVVPVLGGLAMLAFVVAIIATISGSPTNRGWHDDFAGGTAVIRDR